MVLHRPIETTGINGQVIEAAVAPLDGTGRFASSEYSIMGRLAKSGTPVSLISVASIMKEFGVSAFAVVKIDIEGAEQALFAGPRD